MKRKTNDKFRKNFTIFEIVYIIFNSLSDKDTKRFDRDILSA